MAIRSNDLMHRPPTHRRREPARAFTSRQMARERFSSRKLPTRSMISFLYPRRHANDSLSGPASTRNRQTPALRAFALRPGTQEAGIAFPEADAFTEAIRDLADGLRPPPAAGKTPALRARALRPGTQDAGIAFPEADAFAEAIRDLAACLRSPLAASKAPALRARALRPGTLDARIAHQRGWDPGPASVGVELAATVSAATASTRSLHADA